jgi:hypothetical protein
MKKIFSINFLYLFIFQALVSCGIYRPVDAKKYPPQPELRVKNNIEEGRGFRLMMDLEMKKVENLNLQMQTLYGEPH